MISRPQSPFYQRNNRLEKWKYLIDLHLLFYYLLEEISTPLYWNRVLDIIRFSYEINISGIQVFSLTRKPDKQQTLSVQPLSCPELDFPLAA